MGLHNAFPNAEIIGVDIKPQPHYPFQFIHADALVFPLNGFNFIWASPPCQAHTSLKSAAWDKGAYAAKHIDLIPQTRKRLREIGTPYIIENVIGAPLIRPLMLCGSHFGLQTESGHQLRRHRIFECEYEIEHPGKCSHKAPTIGIFGDKARNTAEEKRHYSKPIETRGKPPKSISLTLRQAQQAMQIDWMNFNELSEAVPPIYAEYLIRNLYPLKYKKPLPIRKKSTVRIISR